MWLLFLGLCGRPNLNRPNYDASFTPASLGTDRDPPLTPCHPTARWPLLECPRRQVAMGGSRPLLGGAQYAQQQAAQAVAEGSARALAERLKGLAKAATLFSQQKDLAFLQKSTEEQTELLNKQVGICETQGSNCATASRS